MHYSPSTRCFYPDTVKYTDRPDDAVSISYEGFLAAMNRGPGQSFRLVGDQIVIEDMAAPEVAVDEAAQRAYLTESVQRYIDAPAIAWGYDDAKSAVTYVGDPHERFNAEGLAIRAFRSACWVAAEQVLQAVQSGASPAPSEADVIAALPPAPTRPQPPYA